MFELMCQLSHFQQIDYDLQSDLETYAGTLQIQMLRVSGLRATGSIAASTAEVTCDICVPPPPNYCLIR
jgi:hypothetical protein